MVLQYYLFYPSKNSDIMLRKEEEAEKKKSRSKNITTSTTTAAALTIDTPQLFLFLLSLLLS